jgi:hypothetical protein
MGCGCKGRKVVEQPKPEPQQIELPKEEIDWYNNIDIIEPISGQTQN